MVDTEPLGRRERKKAATRTAILEAATALFLERGFDAVTVREIADQADVTPKTVFTHFPQKEALVFADEKERHDRLVAAVRDRGPGVGLRSTQNALPGGDRRAENRAAKPDPRADGRYTSADRLRGEDVAAP